MRRDFSNVIEQRNAKDASESDRLRGQQRAEELQVAQCSRNCSTQLEYSMKLQHTS